MRSFTPEREGRPFVPARGTVPGPKRGPGFTLASGKKRAATPVVLGKFSGSGDASSDKPTDFPIEPTALPSARICGSASIRGA